MNRGILRVVCATVAALLLTGCEFTGLNSRPLPFTEGPDGFVIEVQLVNAVNLVPNSEVKVDNITVGAVRRIEFRDWTAVLEVALNDDVQLPKNAIARIGQKSLLGAEYLEISAPLERPSEVQLADGDTIGLANTGRYPETEEVLSALSLLLNGGGLEQIRTISTELNNALRGRTDDYRSVLEQLDVFVGTLDQQRGDIISTMKSLDRFAGRVAAESDTLDRASETIPEGLRALNKDRRLLIRTLRDVANFGRSAVRVVNASQDDLLSNLRSLQPVVARLADAGKDLPEALDIATFPLPTNTVNSAIRGDYINLFATVDLSAQALSSNYLTGGPLDGVLQGILGPPGGSNPVPTGPQPNDPPEGAGPQGPGLGGDLPEIGLGPLLSLLTGGLRS